MSRRGNQVKQGLKHSRPAQLSLAVLVIFCAGVIIGLYKPWDPIRCRFRGGMLPRV
ncbi:Uncharacterised protein [Cedecea neteri]|uniref:Uncharacterized protein n=1 Tax=Cedecea neteri TaxID=158822 RepID=A0A2X3IUY5_9ENTR|nr:Uncharacterised protein [Cedecea neteri]